MNSKIRALVVDDSAFMRKTLSIVLSADSEIEVVDFANDGIEAVQKAQDLKPDIITLDIEMPKMDGLTALKKIMQSAPTSVIMVSSLTSEGAEATLKALEFGAVDFIPKEKSFISVDMKQVKSGLVTKVKTIVRQARLRKSLDKLKTNVEDKKSSVESVISSSRFLPKNGYQAIAIGISTGGPMSLQKVIPKLSSRIDVPIFLVQHMPPKFTQSLANRLNSLSKLNVKEAEEGEPVRAGVVYIAPGGYQMKLSGMNGNAKIHISENPSDVLHKPSVDVMLDSVINVYGNKTLGVIMTGMGHDGLEGIKRLKQLGGQCLAQDESTCVVYGMPKSVVDAGLADVVAPLEKFPQIINMAV